MRLAGYENLTRIFKKLLKERILSNSYIFFGEPQVGKFSFALSVASYIESGKFEIPELTPGGFPKHALRELLVIKPDGDSIGIDKIRDIKHFLTQKPVYAHLRTVIIDKAHKLTTEAQNAALKIAEEPPKESLLILITQNTDTLMPTLQSRFQKIYFPRLKRQLIENLLRDDYLVDDERAGRIAEVSLGRPGRAVNLATDEATRDIYKTASGILKKKTPKREIIESMLNGQKDPESFFTELIAELANEPIKNYDTLRIITERLTAMSQFSTNKRLQLETALWNI